MIPVIDFNSESVLDEIREAYTTVGFAVFSNALNKEEFRQESEPDELKSYEEALFEIKNR